MHNLLLSFMLLATDTGFVNKLSDILEVIDDFLWEPVMLVLLVGTGIFLTIRTRFLSWRNLGYALKSVLSKEARSAKEGDGDVSPLACLTTSLAATIGTGNIVGVATAMVSGGPGALVWMWVSAFFGLTSKFSECMLAIKYREVNDKGEMSGGPMYTMKNAFKNKKLGAFLGILFATFTVLASFGIGNLTQANSIAESIQNTFSIQPWVTGVVVTALVFLIVIGGIKTIAKVSTVVVPCMAILYALGGLIVIVANYKNIPSGLATIFTMAFNPKAVGGGILGSITISVMSSVRYGVARGVFSNEAGLGSAAIIASAATTNNHIKQGYISMTSTFFDTIVVCSITGLAIAASGVLGSVDESGELIKGASLTISAFKTTLGSLGAYTVCVGIALFAFSTLLGWEYQGEKAFEYITQRPKISIIYRIVFCATVYIGATTTLKIAWNFSDIANALMAIPNLIALIVLSGVVAKDMIEFQNEIKAEKEK